MQSLLPFVSTFIATDEGLQLFGWKLLVELFQLFRIVHVVAQPEA